MKRYWLLFSQAVTVLLAVWFVLVTLKPEWVRRMPTSSYAWNSPSARTIELPSALLGELPGGFRVAVKQAAPAVVSINTARAREARGQANPWFRFFDGEESDEEQAGLGSGVIVDPNGYILTNNHVVEDADEIQVVLNDGRQAQAKVIGTDPDTDLALLKIDMGRLPVIQWGASEDLQVGDPVLAIGNPFGVGQTVTSGIVSALGRNQLGINTFENFIQTDAAINPGNSGGALVDAQGRLQGINTAIYSRSGGSLGIGFAIPVSTARKVIEELAANGQVVRGWIGVEPTPLNPELAQTFALPDVEGVVVTAVLQNAPAHRAGIRPGDLLLQVAGQEVTTVEEVLAKVAALPPGKSAQVVVQRGNQRLTLQVTPAQRPKPKMPR
jgi:serine protease DegQ